MPDLIEQYRPVFEAAGREWNVDPAVLMALAKHEGGGDPTRRGASGEYGMTQIMPATAAHLGITDLRDPVQQIYGAAKYINEALTAERENPYAALAYYNGGPGWRGNPRRDPNYPAYVLGQYKQYAKADTGSMTDATPAPVESTGATPKAPADMTDAEWLDAQSKTYPGLAGPNADRAQPADTGKGPAVAAPSADDLLRQMRELAPPPSGASGGATGGPDAGGSNTSAKPAAGAGAPSADDLLRQMQELAPVQADKKATPPGPQPALPPVSEYGDLGNAWWNTQANPPPGEEGGSVAATGAALGRVG
jgi:hypothetical protein